MKVYNLESPRSGKPVANQFIIEDGDKRVFQSYDTTIAIERPVYEIIDGEVIESGDYEVLLDEYYWNYSRTTSKYRNEFLGESTKETQAKIDSGEYKLVNLN